MDQKLLQMKRWWDRENRVPLFSLCITPGAEPDLTRFWPSPDAEPDCAGQVRAQVQWMNQVQYLADSIPYVGHSWGGRGTPMIMAAYLGGKVRFGETTVWVDPVIDDWEHFRVVFEPSNPWVWLSRRLMLAQIELSPQEYLPILPDFGDALTVFSLLRGPERLLVDLVDLPRLIEEKVREYLTAWKEAHRYFWDVYRTGFPGDCSYLGWAPGRTYICQCDFSTMISPAMFRRFVVPEIESLAGYLEYMPWHLDGPEEIKHLDMLLELPSIRAVQVQPVANGPSCASPLWMPQAKKIQAKRRNLMVCAATPEDLRTLIDGLEPEGLLIGISRPLADLDEARPFVEAIERRYGPISGFADNNVRETR